MASLVPAPPIPSTSRVPSHTAPTTMRAAAQRPPSAPQPSAGPIRSARRVKKGVVSTGTDVQHVIRVTVLGFAGITVDRTKCSDYGKLNNEQKEHLPVPPSKMRAVVAFSRNSQIRGITSLSKPLARSPNDDIVLTSSDDDTTGTSPASSQAASSSKVQKRKGDSDSFGSDLGRAQRHVAVWASESKTGLGSAVIFEAHLHRKDKIGGRASPASSAFAPKSFELTIALTEEGKRGNRVAMPLGVTSLAVAGDECEDGKAVILDLPVLSLQQARPLASNKNGFNGYPMISINEKTKPTETPVEEDPKRRRSGLKRFFSRKHDDDDRGAVKYPTVTERNAFSAAYSTDGTGDAILRVSLEVFEKGSDLARQFEPRGDSESASGTSWVFEPPPKAKRSTSNPSQRQLDPLSTQVPQEVTMSGPTTTKEPLTAEIKKSDVLGKGATEKAGTAKGKSCFQPITKPRLTMKAEELPKRAVDSSNRGEPAHKGFNPIEPSDSATTATSSGTSGSSFDRSDRSSLDQSHAETTDSDESDRHFHLERAAEGAKQKALGASSILKINSVGTEGTFNDDYTLSFTKKETLPVAPEENWEPPNQTIKIFGRKFDLPTCGAWNPNKDDDKTTTNNNKGGDVDKDDFTHVTADFFGRDVHIPVCSAMRGRDDDTLSATATTFTNHGWTRGQPAGFVDKLCRTNRGDSAGEDEESLSWITNLTDGSPSKKKMSLKDYVRLSLTSNNNDPRSDSQTLNSLLSTEETTVDEDASYIEEVTVDEDGAAVLEARDGSDERGASGNGSTKRSGDRITEESPSHAPAVRNEGYSKRIADPLSSKIVPQQVPSDLRPSMSQHFTELFTCRTSSTTLEEVVQYEPFVSDVPPLIVHDDTDNFSLGDLTANTHEKNINARSSGASSSGGKLLDTSNNSHSTKAGRSKKSILGSGSSLSLVPVAFGGDGLCMGAVENATISSAIPYDSRERNSILSLNPSFENYFADYDDYSILSPEAKAQALAQHTKITPSSSAAATAYKEKIVLIAPASPASSPRHGGGAGVGPVRERGFEVNAKE